MGRWPTGCSSDSSEAVPASANSVISQLAKRPIGAPAPARVRGLPGSGWKESRGRPAERGTRRAVASRRRRTAAGRARHVEIDHRGVHVLARLRTAVVQVHLRAGGRAAAGAGASRRSCRRRRCAPRAGGWREARRRSPPDGGPERQGYGRSPRAGAAVDNRASARAVGASPNCVWRAIFILASPSVSLRLCRQV